MKKTLSWLCAIVVIAATLCSSFSVSASEDVTVTDAGTMYVSKVNGLWSDPTTNTLILIPPGSSLSGLYYHKLYAVYDASAGGYVVQEKVSSHRNFTKTIPSNGFGLCLDYAPGTSAGASFARENFLVWCKIRVGDVLTISGIDLAAKTIQTSGTFGTSDFVSNAKVNVKTVRSPIEKTAYTNKTIVALGDSVTSNGGWTEAVGDNIGGYIINSGVGGDRTNEGIKRFDTYVKQFNPDIVIIMYAINDVIQYTFNDATISGYRANLKTLYNKCKDIGATVVFMSPNDVKVSAYDYSKYQPYGGLDACMKKFVNIMKEVAEETGSAFINNYAVWDKLTATDYLCDGVHPNGEGYDININTITNYLKENALAITGSPFYPVFELKTESESTFDISDREYFRSAKSDLSIDSVIAAFSTDVEIYDANSVKVTGEGLIKTGYTIKKKGDDTVEPLTVIIYGDVNCDGLVTSTDYLLIKKEVYRDSGDEARAIAADVSKNGKVTVTDYIMIKRYLNNTYQF